MDRLMTGVRRRLRVGWAIATAESVGPVVMLVILLCSALGWVTAWASADRAALAAFAIATGVLVVGALAIRIPPLVAARAADRGLETSDAFATALELRATPADPGPSGPFGGLVTARAERFAADRTPRDAMPLAIRPLRVAALAVLGVLIAVSIVATSPQDRVRERRATDRAVLRAEAVRLRKAADTIDRGTPRSPTRQALAARIRSTASRLERVPTLADGRRELRAAAEQLRRQVDPNALAAKAAFRGIERSLQARPLLASAGASSAPQQIIAASKQVADLPSSTLGDIADRAEALAAAQRLGDPKTASALADAAAKLRAGDRVGAARALNSAAGALTRAQQRDADADLASATAASLSDSAQTLGLPPPPSDGGPSGSGGSGAKPQVPRNGTGGGKTDVPTEGGRNANPTGTIAGASKAGGNGVGSGRAGAGDRPDDETTTPGAAKSPVFGTGKGETLAVGGPRNAGRAQIVGRSDGPTRPGEANAALAESLPAYQAAAGKAAETLDLPASQRAVVREYFASLSTVTTEPEPPAP